jgi:phospholipase C
MSADSNTSRPDIRHIFVLAMENRSFDHLFAFAGLPAVQPPDFSFGMNANASDPVAIDPPHEFEDVQAQIGGEPPMSGFAHVPYTRVSMAGFPTGSAPILRALAQEFLLFDNWFSSMPGPTWPNRFFFHAASSGGLANSPSTVTTLESETVDSLSFDFEHGTIYEQLSQAGKKWRIYHDDLFPQVLAIKHMIEPFRRNTATFSSLRSNGVDCFSRDVNAGYDVDYTFIEPDYGLTKGGFQHGNCQHPLGSLAAGEAFIQYVYETIRNSPLWPNSLLIVTYDEHGGFFDHVRPPEAVPPGDDDRNRKRAQHPQDFTFDQLGVRVPALAISPWIARGSVGSKVFPGQCFDHTAILSTVRQVCGLPAPLTRRDAAAASIAGACNLSAMRTDPPRTLGPLPGGAASGAAAAAATPVGPPDQNTEGFARIAMSLDLAMAAAANSPPLADTHPLFGAPMAPLSARSASRAAMEVQPAAAPADRRAQLVDYMQAVAERRRTGAGASP